MKLLSIGSIAFDSIITPFGKVKKTLGGSANYISLASSIFTPTAIVGVVGNDFHKFEVYKKHKVDISGVEKRKGKTFHWSGKYHFDMNTRDTLKTELGVFAGFRPKLDDNHRKMQYVFLGSIQPKLQLEVLRQIKEPKLVGLDTFELWIKNARKDLLKVMREIDVLVINDSEARQISKEHNLLKGAKKILKLMGGQRTDALIIKQGEHGLLMFNQGKLFNLPGYPLEDVVDPTGAGDSFAGGFMGYLAKTDDLSHKNLKKACVLGTVIASYCVEKFGTKALETITDKNVKKRYNEFRQLTHFNI